MVLIWHGVDEIPGDFGPTAVTIGNFDGVHRGHQQVLARLLATARDSGSRAVAVTFDPHPAQVHRPDTAPHLIMGIEDRLAALSGYGLDAILVLHYTLEFAQQSAEDFVRGIFVDALRASHVVVGHDVRFGRGNAGDLAAMQHLGERFGFGVVVVDEFTEHAPRHRAAEPQPAAAAEDDADERRCSSTWVREALESGDVRTAAEILGRPHAMHGTVVHGASRGRALGFPTANLSHDAAGHVPADGIYAGWLLDQAGTRWPAAISVGSNPTFEGVARQVEAHVIDRPDEAPEDFDLYGQNVVVEFVDRLRGMVAYRGPAALVEQMKLDVDAARDVLAASGQGGASPR
ncbi:bifunctional riboflavin kinase/FAD synthetase [Sinomonas atrocyanea]|uniref:bifunctional riboflavin kinase/FAD synthetase n=1 Tax=Sinomonas atrocyanea TaxID=37927 RepID=UPI002789C910|nr:bifunctional riboflavin kinase/FAD synthetase [Sinomonas atrocyanea]MDQ0259699.1 riboflavin kinase/FMN adenylyltransferase [Sinomonas atrocyanea]MDR6621664.1 riboflavin kinase/FMN adenylyltransferase [Sinomonas atrocyanea]